MPIKRGLSAPTHLAAEDAQHPMGCGDICHRDHILNEVCYEAKITDLIRDGYLCPILSKVGAIQPVLEDVRRNSGGDYIIKSLSEATNRDKVVCEAVSEAVRIIRAKQRQAVMFFCVDVEHCQKVHRAPMDVRHISAGGYRKNAFRRKR